MRIIVHIGVHKTGTTALQSFFHKNSVLLSQRGILYKPDPTVLHNHHCIAIELKRGSSGSAPLLLNDLIQSSGAHHTILLSSEMLCEPGVDVDLFLSCLRGHDLYVIAYIRHPCDIVISAFSELVRDPGTKWTRPLNQDPFAYPPDQIPSLKPWIERVNVKLAPYDPKQWVGGSLFSDFLNMIDVKHEGFDLTSFAENVSLSFPVAETLRLFNTLNPSEDQHRIMVEHLRTINCEQSGYPLFPETVELFLHKMQKALPLYRPFYRPDFLEDFLLELRPRTNNS